jgi:hypothetical protein
MSLEHFLRKDTHMSFWEWVILFTGISFFIEMVRSDPRPYDNVPWLIKVVLRTFGDFLWIVCFAVIIKFGIYVINL